MINRLVNLITKHTEIDIPPLPSHEHQDTQAKEILKCLRADGILHYMKTKYNHNHINVINVLFNKMIDKYSKEYNLIISYEKNCINIAHNDSVNQNNSRYYERKIFNQADLIPKTFQFLQLIDINQCCLVNSIWLYHGYNINSIYYIKFDTWMKIITQSDSTTNNDNLEQKKRFLQRTINIRKFKYCSWTDVELSQSFIDQCKQFHNIEHFKIEIKQYQDKERQIIDIISKHSKKLKSFECGFQSKSEMMEWNSKQKQLHENSNFNLPTFYLNNCETIELKGLLFPIIFTNTCNVLNLSYCNKISKQWCQNVINSCDFCNIKRLWLSDISFDKSINSNNKKIFINQIASKCNNLEKFCVGDPTEDILLIWKGLIPTIKKNNVCVEIIPFAYESLKDLNTDICDKLYQLVNDDNYKNECGINVLVLFITTKSCIFYKKLLSMKNIESRVENLIILSQYGNECAKNELFEVKKMYEKYQHLLLYFIKGGHDNITFQEMINLLNIYTTSKHSEQKCFVKLDWDFVFHIEDSDRGGPSRCYDYPDDKDHFVMYDEDDDLKEDMQKLFERIINMIDDQIPMELDIRLKTRFVSESDKARYEYWYLGIIIQIYKLFLSAFDKYVNINLDVNTSHVPQTMDMDTMESNDNADKYKQPKCNKYCKFLPVPVFEFYFYDTRKQRYSMDDFLVANLTIQTALAHEDSW